MFSKWTRVKNTRINPEGTKHVLLGLRAWCSPLFWKRSSLAVIFTLIFILSFASPVWAFCGFYVSQANTSLYNQASQVILARNGDRTVLTMASDYQGKVKDFALVVPVPTVLQKEQVHVGDPTILERLDQFTAPRLVEYFDSDPCAPILYEKNIPLAAPSAGLRGGNMAMEDDGLGVKIEAKFTVGEYDILILSAKESNGLETWLRQNKYQIPRGASEVLRPYIRQGMKFFVAKVNLQEFDKTGSNRLRPLMMAYESPKFMLPIRLGMINAQGDQDLVVYLLSPQGRIELTNYRTQKVPSDLELPEFVQEEFGQFYKDMFHWEHQKNNRKVAFLEYAWNMSSCDPCATPTLTPEELKQAGVFWYDQNPDVFVTRLHVRYRRDRFGEDLQFQNTPNQEFFQGRYVIRHPFRGEGQCPAMKNYVTSTRQRQEQEAQTLSRLTRWKVEDVRKRVQFLVYRPDSWWNRLFNFIFPKHMNV